MPVVTMLNVQDFSVLRQHLKKKELLTVFAERLDFVPFLQKNFLKSNTEQVLRSRE